MHMKLRQLLIKRRSLASTVITVLCEKTNSVVELEVYYYESHIEWQLKYVDVDSIAIHTIHRIE